MKKASKRIIALFLILVLLCMNTACGGDISMQFDEGANRFGQDKDIQNYTLPNSGDLLSRLIDDFSGSLEPPFSQKMDDDGFDQAKKKAEEDRENNPDGNAGQSVSRQVGNYDELLDAFMDAYVPGATTLEFQLVDGYTVNLTGDMLNDMYRVLQREDPIGVAAVAGWTYGNRGNDYIVEIRYNIGPEELSRIKKETPALVDKAIEEMNVGSTDPYTIVCAVNTYLCDTVVYPPNEPYPPLTHTAYGAFHGDAVCEGYATAAKLMLNKLGVVCDIENGVCIGGGGHAWNLVQLDGQWYQLDITWNDCGGKPTEFLLVTDAFMKQSRTWDESQYPKCAATPYKP